MTLDGKSRTCEGFYALTVPCEVPFLSRSLGGKRTVTGGGGMLCLECYCGLLVIALIHEAGEVFCNTIEESCELSFDSPFFHPFQPQNARLTQSLATSQSYHSKVNTAQRRIAGILMQAKAKSF